MSLLVSYYLGSVPFIIGLLYFWGDMSHNAFAGRNCAAASFGMALLFIWMKCWQTVFAVTIRNSIHKVQAGPWPLTRMTSLIATQSLIQSTSFFVLPLAFVLLVPLGWCYAFYQNATALADGELHDLKMTARKSWQHARLWPRQNHFLIFILSIFSMVVLINLSIGFIIIPYLLKTFLNIETPFSMSGASVFNSTFWFTMIAGTYLCVDPIIKTAYVLRCYYGNAVSTGEDILTELKSHARTLKTTAIVLVFVISPALLSTGVSAQTENVSEDATIISPEMMEKSIIEVMKGREFTWRLPPEELQQIDSDFELPGPVESVLFWIRDSVKKLAKTIGAWLGRFFEWLKKNSAEKRKTEKTSNADWIPTTRLFLVIFLVVAAGFLAYFLWSIWRRRRSRYREVETEPVPLVPDLTDENTVADELPADQWLALAKKLKAKGSLRLAMRALYLATLAYLGDHEMVSIEKYKSNSDYERELQRRAHGNLDLTKSFSKNVIIFDRVWYGLYHITPQDIDSYAMDQDRIKRFAEK